MATRVGSKGQVVIEKEIRDRLGVLPGCLAVQRLVGDRVEISFVRPEHDESVRGRLAARIGQKVPPSSWKDAVETAWEASVHEPEAADDGG